MPLIYVSFSADHKTIALADKNDCLMFTKMSVDNILSLDVQAAKDIGGTYKDLWTSWRPAKPRISQKDVDEGVQRFLSGDED